VETRFEVDGLADEVEIIVDSWGVPHIYARSEADVFIAQGFNAARDRLFQIDLWRRRGLGRLAAVFGSAFVEQDAAARAFLYRGDMRAEWLAYGSDTEAVVGAFVLGVNAYIEWACADPSRLPPEFLALDYRPEPWQAADVARVRSHGLYYNAEQELARALTLRDFGAAVERMRARPEPEHAVRIPEGLDLDALREDVLDTYRLALGPAVAATGGGSNNWVIAGSRTTTGRPILANDPHRALTLPSLRYIAHLSAPGLDVIGGGEPALPGISIGHNGHIAFGLTIFPIDQEDIYVYRTHPGNADRYEYAGGWEPMAVVADAVEVRGGEPVAVTHRFTRHGPVVYRDPTRHVAIAVRAAWLQPGMAPYLGSMDYMRAPDCDAFLAAMSRWGAPGENQVYAAPDGTIGWRPAGLVPRRPNWDGMLPVPGDGQYEWDGFLDADELPGERDPDRGWIATANQHNLPTGYDQTITYDWYPDFRYRRIAEVLAASDSMSLADCVALQNDYRSKPAEQVIALLRTCATDEEIPRPLREWDGEESPDSVAATVFEVWLRRHLRPALRSLFLRRAGVADRDLPAALRRILPDEAPSPDPRIDLALLHELADETPLLRALLLDTLRAAIMDITARFGPDDAAWAWGGVHHSTLVHPMRPAMADPPPWTVLGPTPRGGSEDTVGSTAYDNDYNQTSGATFRLVIDVGGWDNSVAMNSPGQAGDPRSPHYQDLFRAWAADGSFPLLYSRDRIEQHISERLKLVPLEHARPLEPE
jgi:penicillin G amidase